MSKVKVNREIFEALESTKEWEVTEERRLELIMNYYSTKSFVGKRRILNRLNLKLFLDILRFGYELELTLHQDLKEFYERYKALSRLTGEDSYFSNGVLYGVSATLEILKESVVGVNK